MARTEDIPEPIRSNIANVSCPSFVTTPFNVGPPLRRQRIGIISSAALIRRGDQPFHYGSAETRAVPNGPIREILTSHVSTAHDRSGFQRDINTIYPIERLHELAADGAVGGVADTNFTVMGSTDPSIPANQAAFADSADQIAAHFRQQRIDSILLCPV
jgi:D-proline reductase (dithiol) PrdB